MTQDSDQVEIQWHRDPDAAARYSRQNARRIVAGCDHLPIMCHCEPPDWLRCDYVTVDLLGTARCAQGAGHGSPHKKPRGR